MALYKEDGYYENFDVIAADPRELANINQPRLLDGGELVNFTGNQVVLPDRFTSKFSVEQGDSFTLWINGEAYEFTVDAIAAYDTVFLRHTRVPVETLSAILGSGEGYSEILIEPSDGVDTASLQTELKEALPQKYNANRVVNEAQVEADARQKSMPFFLISFFSLAISVFIIFSSYKVITLERELRLGGEQIPPNSRELFSDYLEQLNTRGLTDIQRAARYFYIIRITYSCNKKALNNSIDRLPEIQERLKDVVIENRDFEALVKTYDRKKALSYFDPPYFQAEKYYDGFSPDDHKRLYQCICGLKGQFVLSYNDHPEIRTLYKDFHIHEVDRPSPLTHRKISTVASYKELIITGH